MSSGIAPGVLLAWQTLLGWFAAHETFLIFFAILMEESGVPMPIPADVAMALAGFRVAQGQMSLLEAFLIGQSATLIGSSILYWVGRRGGRVLLFRYGKVLHLSPSLIARTERLVLRLGPMAVIIGRQIPGLRLAAPLASGVFRVPYRLFLPAMFVGSSLYIGIFIAVGMWGGPRALAGLRAHGLPLRFVSSSVLLLLSAVALWLLSRRAREGASAIPVHRTRGWRRRSVEAGLLAGLGASALVGLSITWFLELLGLIFHSPPEQALLRALQRGVTPALASVVAQRATVPQWLLFTGLSVAAPFQVVTHVAWAQLYVLFFEPRLKGSATQRGLRFSVLPWLFSGLVLYPLVGAGLFGVRLAGPVTLVGDLGRNVIFGVTLGLLYRLVRQARQPRLHTGHRHGHRAHPASEAPLDAAAGASVDPPAAAPPVAELPDLASGTGNGAVAHPVITPLQPPVAESGVEEYLNENER